MTDLVVLLAVLALWFILNLWVLPRLGMQTCLSGMCGMKRCPQPEKSKTSERHDPDQTSRLPEQGE
ncbi:hypothetical protein Pan153_07010 [Gimesia panareensis]|uniref:Uncharacterized protein n=1 Tax=Gimesia panareensis TaxID=2527978 RepID=A0A518FII0_9PLAN|nr:hypothetical protein [Gimesia panareensis]QDV16080.1 hypothetical protein Pan153_07010 [Gimesia panareensis]